MSHFPLSSSSDWELVYDEQDIRGWEVRDGADNVLGTVDDMIVNSETKHVDLIRLEDGTEYPAHDIHIGDGVVYIEGVEAEGVESIVKVYDDYGRVVRTEHVDEDVYAGYDDTFRKHYNTTFAASGQDYGYYEPGYRFGYELASSPRYEGKTYDEIEPEARRLYGERYDDADYDERSAASRYAYDHHRTQPSFTP